ncbi:uncharacterized protein CDAR_108861 [Caerostris darwini]|uniref:Ig-like domain-containing protein n=1 Tax=Caerostris darwini TaxID=1538125 RepID=A0AAV4R9C4_9ARAC|nr:uncharacterized protein CDAR_108861 [Caerostris darwini]
MKKQSNINTVKGDPSPAVRWLRNAELLDDSYYITPQGFSRNELLLSSLKRTDLMSSLTCQVSNSNPSAPVTSTVVIDTNPYSEAYRCSHHHHVSRHLRETTLRNRLRGEGGQTTRTSVLVAGWRKAHLPHHREHFAGGEPHFQQSCFQFQ